MDRKRRLALLLLLRHRRNRRKITRRMSVSSFECLLKSLEPHIRKNYTNMRNPVEPVEMLGITLRYLGSGNSITDLHFKFKRGKSTIAYIIQRVCRAIWTNLLRDNIPELTTESFQTIARGFDVKANFPQCIGNLRTKCDTMKSSFNGLISEIPYIRVDNFENKMSAEVRAYFLSHYHSDHIVGLHTDVFLEHLEKKAPKAYLYCTELTAAFIDDDLSHSHKKIMEYVKPLKMGSTLITLPPIDENNELLLTVTLIPAGHCAGSTMFLFKTSETTVLYTGDFRININDLPKYKALHSNEEPIKIDALYIDTTFLDEDHEYFPKRSESVDAMLNVMVDWLKTVDNAVSIHTSARYGYEYVFNEIYKNLGIKVYVSGAKWKLYSKIQHLVPGVTNSEYEKRIHLCGYPCENKGHSYINANYNNYLHIHLSARKWDNCSPNSPQIRLEYERSLSVCFATHCSAREILYFKNYFPISKVVGFPEAFRENIFENKAVMEPSKVDENVLRLLLH
ncbi:unnamed protein product, partial [Brenthis ino]